MVNRLRALSQPDGITRKEKKGKEKKTAGRPKTLIEPSERCCLACGSRWLVGLRGGASRSSVSGGVSVMSWSVSLRTRGPRGLGAG